MNRVRLDLVVGDHHADGRRAHQEAVVIVVNTGRVVVVVHAELRRVALEKEILLVDVREDDLLFSSAPGIQAAVGVLLKQVEVGQVVLPAVGIEVAEKTHTGLLVDEKKAPEIGVELLNARAHGNEVEVRAQVVDFYLSKEFLKAEVRVQARGAIAHVDIHYAELAHVEIVQADDGSHSNPPVHRTEGRIAMKQVKGEKKQLIQEKLLAFAEKIAGPRTRRADVAWNRQASTIDQGVADCREVKKCLLPENRHIPFPFVAVKGIPLASPYVGMFAAGSVAIPIGHGDAPAIRLRLKDV